MNTITLHYDISPENPRDWCNLGTLCLRDNGDEPIKGDFNEYLLSIIGKSEEIEVWERVAKCDFYTNQMRDHLLNVLSKTHIYHLVYKYEHSGVAYSTSPFSCRFDSGLAGIIYISKANARKEYNVKRINAPLKETTESILASEVQTFSQWANGDVYGYEVKNESDDVIDSCWGFYDVKDMVSYMNHEDFGFTTIDELISHLESLNINY